MTSQPGRPRTHGPVCGANRTGGGTCGNPAGQGTPTPGVGRCYRHGGCTPSQVAHNRHVMAEDAAQRFGLPLETTAEEALTDALNLAAGRVRFYLQACQELTTEQMTQGVERITRRVRQPGGPEQVTETVTVAKTTKNIWLILLDEAERHRVQVAEIMARLNIEDRQLQMSQAQGQQFYDLTLFALQRSGLTPQQQEQLKAALPGAIEAYIGEPVAGEVLPDD